MNRRLPAQGQARQRLRLGTLLTIAVLVALNLAGGMIGGRLDLTPGNAYTLSRATRNLARGLDDIVTLKLFASKELPAEFGLVRRDVGDLLRDLRAAGDGKLRVIQRDPGADSAAAEEARTLGIQPVQFNVVGQAELSVREGYFGLAIQHAGRQEVIPFVERSDDLEYRIASAIRNLSRDSKPKLALITDQQAGGFQAIRAELSRSYEVESPVLADSTPLGRDLAAVVIIALRDSLSPEERSKLDGYLRGGGKLMVMESGMQVSNQGPFAMARPLAFNPVLEPYGVQINGDMVYDLRANQMIGVPTGFLRVLRPYPYFLRAQSTRASPVNAELAELGLAWTSSLDTAKAKPGTVTPLFVTSEAAGLASGMAMIDPAQQPPQTELGTRLLAVQVIASDSAGGARLVVVGNSLMASDEMGRRSPENLVFVLNAVDWLAQDDALIAIRAKDRRPPPLVFESSALKQGIKYLNVAVLPLLIAGFGFVHLARRRRLAGKAYTGGGSA
jgi:ABC-type uncharacterized transport system involved in gliding motility auxiliary subunit